MKLKEYDKEFINEVLRLFSDSDFDVVEGIVTLWSNLEEDVSATAYVEDLLNNKKVYEHRDTFDSVHGYKDKGSYKNVLDIFNDPLTSYRQKENIIWEYFLEFEWEFEGIKSNKT